MCVFVCVCVCVCACVCLCVRVIVCDEYTQTPKHARRAHTHTTTTQQQHYTASCGASGRRYPPLQQPPTSLPPPPSPPPHPPHLRKQASQNKACVYDYALLQTPPMSVASDQLAYSYQRKRASCILCRGCRAPAPPAAAAPPAPSAPSRCPNHVECAHARVRKGSAPFLMGACPLLTQQLLAHVLCMYVCMACMHVCVGGGIWRGQGCVESGDGWVVGLCVFGVWVDVCL